MNPIVNTLLRGWNLQSLSSLVRQLRLRPAHITDHEASVAARYSVQLELLQCLQQLYREWQRYIDEGHCPLTMLN